MQREHMPFRFSNLDIEHFRHRVLEKPSPRPRALTHDAKLNTGQGWHSARQSFLFPSSPGILSIAPLRRSVLTDGAKARPAKHRNSAYASWAKDPEKPRRMSCSGKIVGSTVVETSAALLDDGLSQEFGEDGATSSFSSFSIPMMELEERKQRLSRERLEMLEAARRREAEEEQRRAEKDAWQVAALAERRREAVERREREAEQRRREAEAQRRREQVEERRRREKRAAVIAQRHSEEGFPACASDLHGDMLILVFRFLDARGLLSSAMGVRELWHSAAKEDELWLPLCRQRWATKAPRFHLSAEIEATALITGPSGAASWFDAYREAEEDGAREFIFRDELTQLKFQFQWRRFNGQAASSNFRFEEDGFTAGHPFNSRFPWVLDDLGVGIQWGPAQDMFPKGFVSRLADWSWRIENVNAVLIEADVARDQAFDD